MSVREPSRLSKFFRKMADKFFGKYYEGPEPPDRLADMAILFANMHPHATRRDWVEFTAEQSREAYRSGWLRGYENSERDPDDVPFEPEELMDEMSGPDWRERGIILDGDGNFVPKEFLDEDEMLRDQIRETRGVIDDG